MPRCDTIKTLGIASCLGGPNRFCGYSAERLRESLASHDFPEQSLNLQWQMVYPEHNGSIDYRLYQLNRAISQFSQSCTETGAPFLVIGGDHSCAMGTWSGVMKGLARPDQFGLIWLDAHMDAHTFETSPSGNSHGMPVAGLLGKGGAKLQALYPASIYIRPENLIMLGIRSYEQAEFALLKQANVEIIFSRQIDSFSRKLQSAIEKLSGSCQTIGISLDLDLIDPDDAPGVETPAPNGIKASEVIAALASIKRHPSVCGLEICEYNPVNDRNGKTLQLMESLIDVFYGETNPNRFLGSSDSGIKRTSDPN